MDITRYFTENNLLPLVLDHFLDIILNLSADNFHELMNDDSNQYRNFIIDYIVDNFLADAEEDESLAEKILDQLNLLLESRLTEREFLYESKE